MMQKRTIAFSKKIRLCGVIKLGPKEGLFQTLLFKIFSFHNFPHKKCPEAGKCTFFLNAASLSHFWEEEKKGNSFSLRCRLGLGLSSLLFLGGFNLHF